MTRFRRLTWADLDVFTRGELLDRVQAEQRYWMRMTKRGLSSADQQAYRQFTEIMHAVLPMSGFADSMADDAAWLRGERPTASSFWDEKPRRATP